ncbi:hypothetical protein LBMAG53_27030 [Planctomycetota bacterium]|nr:hypothetical protein LBMAG53_27030 [Planctomycetota bacterium]
MKHHTIFLIAEIVVFIVISGMATAIGYVAVSVLNLSYLWMIPASVLLIVASYLFLLILGLATRKNHRIEWVRKHLDFDAVSDADLTIQYRRFSNPIAKMLAYNEMVLRKIA